MTSPHNKRVPISPSVNIINITNIINHKRTRRSNVCIINKPPCSLFTSFTTHQGQYVQKCEVEK
jgi:hypothetical protein